MMSWVIFFILNVTFVQYFRTLDSLPSRHVFKKKKKTPVTTIIGPVHWIHWS